MADKQHLLCSRIKSYFWRAVWSPFGIVWYHKVETFVWLMFIIVASQLGTLFNLIQRCLFQDISFTVALAMDSSNGVFYTFALVTISSLIGPLFRQFIRQEKPEYRLISMSFITMLIFTLLFCSVFYAFDSNSPKPIIHKYSSTSIDWSQTIFFALAILFSWYSFGLSLIKEHEDDLSLSDEHLKRENERKETLGTQMANTSEVTFKDPNGENVAV